MSLAGQDVLIGSKCIDYGSKPVTLLMFGSPKEFVVHECIISSIKYFRTQPIGVRSLESDVVYVPEEDPNVINLYLNFLYTGDTSMKVTSHKPSEFLGQTDVRYAELTKIYTFADKLEDISSKNAVISKIFKLFESIDDEGFNHPPSITALQVVFNGDWEFPYLRRLFVDMWVEAGTQIASSDYGRFPHEFLGAMVQRYKRMHCKCETTRVDIKQYLEPDQPTV